MSSELPNDILSFVADIEARHAKANLGPIDVHRYDNDGGSIAYQLQQSGRGEDSVVLCAFDDDDNPKARHDAEFAAKAWADVPALCRIVREQVGKNELFQEALGLEIDGHRFASIERDTLLERLTLVEGPAQRLVYIDNDLAEGRDVAAKASLHDAVMRPIEELRVYFGNVKRAAKRGQTIFDWEVDRRKRAECERDELRERLAKLEAAARFAYDAILESSVCDEPCGCIDCEMLETLGEALNIPRIGES